MDYKKTERVRKFLPVTFITIRVPTYYTLSGLNVLAVYFFLNPSSSYLLLH